MNRVDFPDEPSRIPSGLKTDQFILRPLRMTDVELDYDAVMSSRAMLRAWSQSDWPAEIFTLEGNLDDLERHQREHDAGKAYTFTVMNPEETRSLGCAYINPLPLELQEIQLSTDLADAKPMQAAFARFWVRRSLQEEKLDLRLLKELMAWFRDEWLIAALFFRASPVDNHQQFLFTSAGLNRIHRFESQESNRTWLVFG